MSAWQISAAPPPAIWPRAAIHDTVAAIVRQSAYRRDVTSTLLDRIIGWIADGYRRLVETLGGVPHGRVIATVAAAVVAVLVVARIVYATRLRSNSLEVQSRGRAAVARSTDPWREAEQLAATGQFTEAAHALYRATLMLLAAGGLVRLHESKTTGDYVRELRRRGAPSYAPFRRFGARYDRIIYGDGVCGAAEYTALLSEARAIGAVRVSDRAA